MPTEEFDDDPFSVITEPEEPQEQDSVKVIGGPYTEPISLATLKKQEFNKVAPFEEPEPKQYGTFIPAPIPSYEDLKGVGVEESDILKMTPAQKRDAYAIHSTGRVIPQKEEPITHGVSIEEAAQKRFKAPPVEPLYADYEQPQEYTEWANEQQIPETDIFNPENVRRWVDDYREKGFASGQWGPGDERNFLESVKIGFLQSGIEIKEGQTDEDINAFLTGIKFGTEENGSALVDKYLGIQLDEAGIEGVERRALIDSAKIEAVRQGDFAFASIEKEDPKSGLPYSQVIFGNFDLEDDKYLKEEAIRAYKAGVLKASDLGEVQVRIKPDVLGNRLFHREQQSMLNRDIANLQFDPEGRGNAAISRLMSHLMDPSDTKRWLHDDKLEYIPKKIYNKYWGKLGIENLEDAIQHNRLLPDRLYRDIQKELLIQDFGRRGRFDAIERIKNLDEAEWVKRYIKDDAKHHYGLRRLRRDINEIAFQLINNGGGFQYYSDKNELWKNIRVTPEGRSLMAPQLQFRKKDFIEAIDQTTIVKEGEKNVKLTMGQVEQLKLQRELFMQSRLPQLDRLLREVAPDDVAEEWTKLIIENDKKTEDKKSKVELFDEFLEDDDNYAKVKNDFSAIGQGIKAAFTDIYHGVAAAVFGSESSANVLLEQAKNMQDKREYAKLWGDEWGLGMDFATLVAPVVVDVATTAIAGTVTAGTYGAVVLAKSGAKVGINNYAKAIVGRSLARGVKETSSDKAQRMLAEGLILKSNTKGTTDGVIKAIDGYNRFIQSKLTINSPLFLTSANRSAGGMYTSVYASLKEQYPDATHEWLHDNAQPAALLGGFLTGALTVGLTSLGKGGIESALLSKVPVKNANGLLKSMLRRSVKFDDDIAKASLKKIINGKIKSRLLTVIPELLEDPLWEGVEESLDTFINSFVESWATGEDMSLADRLASSGHAGVLGMGMGAGTGVTTGVVSKIRGVDISDPNLFEEMLRKDVARRVANELRNSNSPLSASYIEQQLAIPWGSATAEGPAPQETTPMVAPRDFRMAEKDKEAHVEEVKAAFEGVDVAEDVSNVEGLPQIDAPDLVELAKADSDYNVVESDTFVGVKVVGVRDSKTGEWAGVAPEESTAPERSDEVKGGVDEDDLSSPLLNPKAYEKVEGVEEELQRWGRVNKDNLKSKGISIDGTKPIEGTAEVDITSSPKGLGKPVIRVSFANLAKRMAETPVNERYGLLNKILGEELTHAAEIVQYIKEFKEANGGKNPTEAELKSFVKEKQEAVYDDMSIAERKNVVAAYRNLTQDEVVLPEEATDNRKASMDKQNIAAEYVRMLVQYKKEGATTESAQWLESTEVVTFLSSVFDRIKKGFLSKKKGIVGPVANELQKHLDNIKDIVSTFDANNYQQVPTEEAAAILEEAELIDGLDFSNNRKWAFLEPPGTKKPRWQSGKGAQRDGSSMVHRDKKVKMVRRIDKDKPTDLNRDKVELIEIGTEKSLGVFNDSLKATIAYRDLVAQEAVESVESPGDPLVETDADKEYVDLVESQSVGENTDEIQQMVFEAALTPQQMRAIKDYTDAVASGNEEAIQVARAGVSRSGLGTIPLDAINNMSNSTEAMAAVMESFGLDSSPILENEAGTLQTLSQRFPTAEQIVPLNPESAGTVNKDEEIRVTQHAKEAANVAAQWGVAVKMVIDPPVDRGAIWADGEVIYINPNQLAKEIIDTPSDENSGAKVRAMTFAQVAVVQSYQEHSQKEINDLVEETSDSEVAQLIADFYPEEKRDEAIARASGNSPGGELAASQELTYLMRRKMARDTTKILFGEDAADVDAYVKSNKAFGHSFVRFMRRVANRFLFMRHLKKNNMPMAVMVQNLVDRMRVYRGVPRSPRLNFNVDQPNKNVELVQDLLEGQAPMSEEDKIPTTNKTASVNLRLVADSKSYLSIFAQGILDNYTGNKLNAELDLEAESSPGQILRAFFQNELQSADRIFKGVDTNLRGADLHTALTSAFENLSTSKEEVPMLGLGKLFLQLVDPNHVSLDPSSPNSFNGFIKNMLVDPTTQMQALESKEGFINGWHTFVQEATRFINTKVKGGFNEMDLLDVMSLAMEEQQVSDETEFNAIEASVVREHNFGIQLPTDLTPGIRYIGNLRIAADGTLPVESFKAQVAKRSGITATEVSLVQSLIEASHFIDAETQQKRVDVATVVASLQQRSNEIIQFHEWEPTAGHVSGSDVKGAHYVEHSFHNIDNEAHRQNETAYRIKTRLNKGKVSLSANDRGQAFMFGATSNIQRMSAVARKLQAHRGRELSADKISHTITTELADYFLNPFIAGPAAPDLDWSLDKNMKGVVLDALKTEYRGRLIGTIGNNAYDFRGREELAYQFNLFTTLHNTILSSLEAYFRYFLKVGAEGDAFIGPNENAPGTYDLERLRREPDLIYEPFRGLTMRFQALKDDIIPLEMLFNKAELINELRKSFNNTLSKGEKMSRKLNKVRTRGRRENKENFEKLVDNLNNIYKAFDFYGIDYDLSKLQEEFQQIRDSDKSLLVLSKFETNIDLSESLADDGPHDGPTVEQGARLNFYLPLMVFKVLNPSLSYGVITPEIIKSEVPTNTLTGRKGWNLRNSDVRSFLEDEQAGTLPGSVEWNLLLAYEKEKLQFSQLNDSLGGVTVDVGRTKMPRTGFGYSQKSPMTSQLNWKKLSGSSERADAHNDFLKGDDYVYSRAVLDKLPLFRSEEAQDNQVHFSVDLIFEHNPDFDADQDLSHANLPFDQTKVTEAWPRDLQNIERSLRDRAGFVLPRGGDQGAENIDWNPQVTSLFGQHLADLPEAIATHSVVGGDNVKMISHTSAANPKDVSELTNASYSLANFTPFAPVAGHEQFVNKEMFTVPVGDSYVRYGATEDDPYGGERISGIDAGIRLDVGQEMAPGPMRHEELPGYMSYRNLFEGVQAQANDHGYFQEEGFPLGWSRHYEDTVVPFDRDTGEVIEGGTPVKARIVYEVQSNMLQARRSDFKAIEKIYQYGHDPKKVHGYDPKQIADFVFDYLDGKRESIPARVAEGLVDMNIYFPAFPVSDKNLIQDENYDELTEKFKIEFDSYHNSIEYGPQSYVLEGVTIKSGIDRSIIAEAGEDFLSVSSKLSAFVEANGPGFITVSHDGGLPDEYTAGLRRAIQDAESEWISGTSRYAHSSLKDFKEYMEEQGYKPGSRYNDPKLKVLAFARDRTPDQRKTKEAKYIYWDEPLVEHAQSIALQQAMVEAKEKGLTHIMLVDAETSLLTQGHHNSGFDHKTGKALGTYPGMNMHYNVNGPSVLRDLTGDDGVDVTAGKHQRGGSNRRLNFKGDTKRNWDQVTGRLFKIPGAVATSLYGTKKRTKGFQPPQASNAKRNTNNIDASRVVEMMELPIFEAGVYQKPGWFARLGKGKLDPRLRRLFELRKQYQRYLGAEVTEHKRVLDDLLTEEFGGPAFAPLETIRKASGSTKGIILSEELRNSIDKEHDALIQTIQKSDRPQEIKDDAIKKANATRLERLNREEQAQRVQLEKEINEAKDELRELSPAVADHIQLMRDRVDALSSEISNLLGADDELKMHFDNQMGIYLTRSYRIFSEEGWMDTVLNDKNFDGEREAALAFFEKQYKEHRTKRIISEKTRSGKWGNKTAEQKQQAAEKIIAGELKQNPKLYQQLMETFLESYQTDRRARGNRSGEAVDMIDSLRHKMADDALPPELRGIMGEYAEDTSDFNLLRTFLNVGNLASQQSFLRGIIELGRTGKEEDWWVLTGDEVKERGLGSKYKMIRDVDRVPDVKYRVGASKFDPLLDYVDESGKHHGPLWAPNEMVDEFNADFSTPQRGWKETLVRNIDKIFLGVPTSAAMMVMTLGSVPFYIRNIASNLLFFGPAQGLWPTPKSIGLAVREMGRAFKSNPEIDAERRRLIKLGVLGDDLPAGVFRDMMRGVVDPDTIMRDLNNKLSGLSKSKGFLRRVKEGGATEIPGLGSTVRKLTDLAIAADAFYKITLFKHEVKHLKKAQDYAVLHAIDDKLGLRDTSLWTQSKLEEAAAQKVLKTAQSYSQRLPIASAIAGSGVGKITAPFIGFKLEIPRIIINTYKVGKEERNSGNHILEKRGKSRRRHMSGMLVASAGGLKALIEGMFGGYEDDEQAFLKDAGPAWAKTHTLIWGKGDEGPVSFDLTYVNPFAIGMDPVSMIIEAITGKSEPHGVQRVVEAVVGVTFLDGQIFMRGLWDLIDNEDQYGDKIVTSSNEIEQVEQIATHLINKAFTPPTLKKLMGEGGLLDKLENPRPTDDFFRTPKGILAAQALPFQPFPIDLEKAVGQHFYRAGEKKTTANEIRSKLGQDKQINEEDVKKIARNYLDVWSQSVEMALQYSETLTEGNFKKDKKDIEERIAKVLTKDGYSYYKRTGKVKVPKLTMSILNKLKSGATVDVRDRKDIYNKEIKKLTGDGTLETSKDKLGRITVDY